MAQYRSASTSIIKRHTKKFTPDDAYTDHYFFLSVLEMLRQKYIQKKKKKRDTERAVQTLTHRTYPPYVAPPKSNMGALIVSEVN